MTTSRRSRVGRPFVYNEPKGRINIGLTSSAVQKLDELASAFGLSRSELIEQIARGIIPIGPMQSPSFEEDSLKEAS